MPGSKLIFRSPVAAVQGTTAREPRTKAPRTTHPPRNATVLGRTSQQDLAAVLIRLTQIMRGWANYFKHAVAKHVFTKLDAFVWWRLIRMLRERHHWSWGDVRRRFTTPTGRWLPIAADGIELFQIASVTVSRYRYRASTIPNPWQPANPV
nr:group II intron maturase-specific domain-containing protein [Streptomyces noursei]